MVKVKLRVRPKSGYSYSKKVQTIELDSSCRLEELLLKSTNTSTGIDSSTTATTTTSRSRRPVAASSHAALFLNGQELALNSSIASHNLQDNQILEGCNSPFMSAALTSLMNDLNYMKRKIPSPSDRNKESLGEVLELPLSSSPSYDLSLDKHYWSPNKWNHDDVQTRIRYLATVKKHLQRDDRNNEPLPPCNTLEDLEEIFKPVWAAGPTGGGRANVGGASNGQTSRFPYSSLGYLLQAKTKKTGKPSTIWLLLERKLQIQEEVRCDVALSAHDDDALEEFIIRGERRLGGASPSTTSSSGSTTGRRRQRNRTTATAAAPPPSVQNNNIAAHSSNNQLVIDLSDDDDDDNGNPTATATSSTSRNITTSRAPRGRSGRPKHYTPEYSSGPFAVLSTLAEGMFPDLAVINRPKIFTRSVRLPLQVQQPQRELSLTEETLKQRAQRRCRSNLYDRSLGPGARNAFACMEGLIAKDLVRMERGNFGTMDDSNIVKWSLQQEKAQELAKACLQFEKAVNEEIPISFTNKSNGQCERSESAYNDLTLIVDSREDKYFIEHLKRFCKDDGISCEERELPAGDYLFITKNEEDDEEVVPLVVERKSWSDLADSVMGRGRSRNRLECVKIDDLTAATNDTIEQQFQQWMANPHCTAMNCQLCKMKRSGCAQVLFIIEGGWCSNRDQDRVQKCTSQKRCQSCRVLMDRHHGVTQGVLQKVLHRLQVQHGCHIYYTSSYNETISSLLMMREILMEGSNFASTAFSNAQKKATSSISTATSLTSLTFHEFCANARNTNAVPIFNFGEKKQEVIESGVLTFASTLNDEDTPWRESVCEQFRTHPLVQQSIASNNIEKSQNSSVRQQKRQKEVKKSNGPIVLDFSDDEDIDVLNNSQDSVQIADGPKSKPECINLLDDSQQTTMSQDSDDDSTIDLVGDDNGMHSATSSSQSQVDVIDSFEKRPLFVLQQMQNYNDKVTKGINNVWKKAYDMKQGNQIADIHAHSIEQLRTLKLNKELPVLCRETLVYE